MESQWIRWFSHTTHSSHPEKVSACAWTHRTANNFSLWNTKTCAKKEVVSEFYRFFISLKLNYAIIISYHCTRANFLLETSSAPPMSCEYDYTSATRNNIPFMANKVKPTDIQKHTRSHSTRRSKERPNPAKRAKCRALTLDLRLMA